MEIVDELQIFLPILETILIYKSDLVKYITSIFLSIISKQAGFWCAII